MDLLKNMLECQDWYRDYARNQLLEPISIVGSFRIEDGVAAVVADMRNKLNIPPHPKRGSWDDYYRFIDPLTQPMMQRRRPTVATQVMPQSELSRTEFFNDFLQRDRMHWGVNVYFHAGDTCVGDFRIWRHKDRGNFTSHEIEALRLVEPAVTAALARTRGEASEAPAPRVADQVERLMRQPAQLSRREAEVAWLVSSGCPDKEIARQLKVQFPTVRYHLGNAFRKLQADNRAGLAARVQCLLDGDPLAHAAWEPRGGPLG